MNPNPPIQNPAPRPPMQNSNGKSNRDNGSAIPIIIVSVAVIVISIIAYFAFTYNNPRNTGGDVWEYADTNATESNTEESESYDTQYTEQDLRTIVREANETMPQIVEEGLRCDEIILEGNYVTYIYSVDEAIYNMRDIKDSHRELRQTILNNVKNTADDELKQLCALCRSTNKGLAFRYVGDETGQTHTVYIGPDEL